MQAPLTPAERKRFEELHELIDAGFKHLDDLREDEFQEAMAQFKKESPLGERDTQVVIEIAVGRRGN